MQRRILRQPGTCPSDPFVHLHLGERPLSSDPLAGGDPIRLRRRRIARAASLGRRIGYGLFGLALVLFAVALAAGFSEGFAAAVIASLLTGSVILAPAIVLGYAVRAAERDDRERGL